jgi:zinc protease
MPMRKHGPFMIGLETRNDQTEQAIDVMTSTVGGFIKDGPDEEELISSKRNITGGFPLRIDSNSKIVEYLAMIGFYDLPLDYLATFNDKVDSVSQEQIRDAFQRRLSTEKMVIIIVGGGEEVAQTQANTADSGN